LLSLFVTLAFFVRVGFSSNAQWKYKKYTPGGANDPRRNRVPPPPLSQIRLPLSPPLFVAY
jgi:hypothetical protein